MYLVFKWIQSPGGDPDPHSPPGGKPVPGEVQGFWAGRSTNLGMNLHGMVRAMMRRGDETAGTMWLSSERCFLSCTRVRFIPLLFCSAFGGSMRTVGEGFPRLRGEESVPRKFTLADLFQRHSHFSQFGK